MLNQISLMGRLTRDPELRRTGSGTPVASLTLAVERDFSAEGEKQTDFIDVVAWRGAAEFVSKYFTKGRMAAVSGRLQIRSWTDKEGGKRKAAEVVSAIMGEEKPNQREKIVLRGDKVRSLIPKNIPVSQTEDYVVKALEHYSRFLRQRAERDSR